jgi:hypothetical protein
MPLRKCAQCGRLFGAEGEEDRCTACRVNVCDQVEADTPTEGLRAQPADALTSEQEETPAPRLCQRCGKHEPLEGQPFCLACQIDLYADMGAVAEEVKRLTDAHRSKDKRGLLATLEEKRGRQAVQRMNPNVVPKIR